MVDGGGDCTTFEMGFKDGGSFLWTKFTKERILDAAAFQESLEAIKVPILLLVGAGVDTSELVVTAFNDSTQEIISFGRVLDKLKFGGT